MTVKAEVSHNPDACPYSVLLTNKFTIDGNRLITTGFFTGPHKMVFILSLSFIILTLLLLIDIVLSFEASINMTVTIIISALLSVFSFRASYLRTMPFEIQIDRDSYQLKITRPDIPDLVFNANEVTFATQYRDYFAKNSGSSWIVACLPDNNRFFLADTPGINDAEALRIGLERWLTITI